ncbi:hypothetical protein BDZ94DRAFT_1242786 [Collybia nuda]|uniref:Uncharacterized protein n=1 Tax=Collybia nuda TaxID=64659 RepID=A0A9P5YGQ1_9AGAR|nr:hypothetical protein BDZ94DRAFT_1242786 [Collybia nuda]
MSPTKINGSDPLPTSEIIDVSEVVNLEADIAQLSALLSQESLNNDDDANVVELLQRLESADGVAQGVENKLDGILGKLDSLIGSLESKDAAGGPVEQPPTTGQLSAKEASNKST